MQKLLFNEKKTSLEFGGSLLKGKRKGKRPVTLSKPLHLVMRSDVAVGKLSLKRFERMIRARLELYALQFHIKVYKLAINRNPLHLCIQGQDREEMTSFLKIFAGIIAKKILPHSEVKLKKFWTQRVYSRVVQWGRDLKGVLAYIYQNELEANGTIPYQPRKSNKKKLVGFQSNVTHTAKAQNSQECGSFANTHRKFVHVIAHATHLIFLPSPCPTDK